MRFRLPHQPALVAFFLLHALVFCAAACLLPWTLWSAFSFATLALGALHLCVAGFYAAGHAQALRLWRGLAYASLAYFAGLVASLAGSAAFIVGLFGGLGGAIIGALSLGLGALGLVTLPVGVWGLCVSRACATPRLERIAVGVVFVVSLGLVVWGLVRSRDEQHAALDNGLKGQDGVAWVESAVRAGMRSDASSARALFHADAAVCARALDPEHATVFVTFRAAPRKTQGLAGRSGQNRHRRGGALQQRAQMRGQTAKTRCLSGSLPQLKTQLARLLGAENARYPVALHLVTGSASVERRGGLFDAFALKGAHHGLCLGKRCLLPEQLVGLGFFGSASPLAFAKDVRFGFDLDASLKALDKEQGASRSPEASGSAQALRRFAARTFIVKKEEGVRELHRGRIERAMAPESLREAREHALRYIRRSQRARGHFQYTLDPYTGGGDRVAMGVPRQAGTTYALCLFGEGGKRDNRAALRSLRRLAKNARSAGSSKRFRDASALAGSADNGVFTLGSTALPLIAYLSCRELVGDTFDGLIHRLGAFVTQMQKPSGAFYTRFDLERGRYDAPVSLYGPGQGVLALVLYSAWLDAEDSQSVLARKTRGAMLRSMRYFGERYWQHPMRSFFFVEENWHCLAAAAALEHQRVDAYERFCVDYARFRDRFRFGSRWRGRAEFYGGFGLGTVTPPQTTPTAGQGETLVAAVKVLRARGEDAAWAEDALRSHLRFLLRQQWDAWSAVFAAKPSQTLGAFSESLATPVVRIDYVQHALAAIAGGERVLGNRLFIRPDSA